MKINQLFTAAALSGALAVILGAFAAHLLSKHLDTRSMEIFETANKYHFIHSIALLLTGVLASLYPGKKIKMAGMFFIAGILIFSGSLYVLSMFRSLSWLGMITPLGGICFIAGWLMILLHSAGLNKTVPSES